MSETVEDYMPTTPDINRERLERLKKECPDWFTAEGQLDIEEIKKAVDSEGANQTERFEFTWFGKNEAKRKAFTPSNATLKYDESRSVHPDKADGNVVIEGENLEVLKLLLSSYREKVKCIYIDPPYNTGKDFVYSDNFSEDKKAYWEKTGGTEEGVKVDTNRDTAGRFHSDWLDMMYSRLLVGRQLLKDNGAIFISIDDHEMAHLRQLCDEVFGEENFIANVIWQRAFSPKNDAKYLSENHDYILIYAKNKTHFEAGRLERTEEQNSRYKNLDNDPRGRWMSDNLTVKTYSEKYDYPIETPSGRTVNPSHGSCWRVSKEKFKELKEDDRIWFGEDGNNVPRLKRFLSEVQDGIVPTSLWLYEEVGHNQEGRQELKEVFDGKGYFDGPKPVKLMKRIFKVANLKDDDIIIDFFAGSGSMGHAALEWQQDEEESDIKFILVQLPELTDKDSDAYKEGFEKISDITIRRIENVIKGYGDKPQPIESGFKVYTLAKSHFPRIEFSPDASNSEEENVEALKKYIAEKESGMETMFNKQDIIDEVLLKNGFMLDYTLTEQPEFEENDVSLAEDDHRKALVCLDKELSEKTVEHFKGNDEVKFICLERALNTSKKWNLKHYLGDKLNAM